MHPFCFVFFLVRNLNANSEVLNDRKLIIKVSSANFYSIVCEEVEEISIAKKKNLAAV